LNRSNWTAVDSKGIFVPKNWYGMVF